MQLTEEFSNLVILPEHLTPIEQETFNGLEPKLKHLKHITTIVFMLIIAGALLALKLFGDEEMPTLIFIIIPALFIFVFSLRTLLIFMGFPKKGYLLREHDISYRKGLLIYKLTTVPFNRVQHVEVSQSFIEKLFQLASVKIFTAGGSVSDVSIPGLRPEKAHEIEGFLLKKISKHE